LTFKHDHLHNAHGYWWLDIGCVRQNRESGENPEQTRYCDRERTLQHAINRATMTVDFSIEKAQQVGQLPLVLKGQSARKSGDRPVNHSHPVCAFEDRAHGYLRDSFFLPA